VTPCARIRVVNDRPVNPHGALVLYWMTSARRMGWNFGLQRAAELARDVRKPLVILEALRCDYPWASDRLHRFVMDGMAHNARAAGRRARYYAYVEPTRRAGRGLIKQLSDLAFAVVTDDYPAGFLPRMLDAGARQAAVRIEAIDSNGLIPLVAHGREFPTARGYRAFTQRSLKAHLAHVPVEDPLAGLSLSGTDPIPAAVTTRWPEAGTDALAAGRAALAGLPIDHGVTPAPAMGGSEAAARALDSFIDQRLAIYGDSHNHPDADATSRLSPYLHFGHLAAHQVFAAVMTRERWTTRKLGRSGGGAREGWWGVSPSAEAFLDQLVVWRELSFNGSAWTLARGWDAVPAWARRTLDAHLADPREHLYTDDELDAAATHDPIWNAAQRQLAQDGWFHGYMRMVWGKKILEWSPHPADALVRMEHLMNRYSLDGRDPVSYASFGWVLGRYDRPWFERPIFGTVRYMTSESAARKLRLRQWLARYGPDRPGLVAQHPAR
jgi:deoxyribodipyrimidine photo-lyase